ncbi:hypothetical protein ABBQ38_010911 [Trebouxia sp. C0009 RCD-2024]
MTSDGFWSYDFASDERWNRYCAGIEIPPGRDEDSILHKYKAKWYQREVDNTFDPGSVSNATPQSSTTRTAAADTSTHAPEPTPAASTSGQEQAEKDSPQASPMPTAAHAGSAAKGIRKRITRFWTQLSEHGSKSTQTALFCLHVMLIMLAMLHLQPLNRKLSRMAWIFFLQTSLLSHGFKVYLKAGFPVLRRSGFLQSLQSWLQRVGTTTDFQYIMLSAMFLPQQSVSLVVVPITVLAVYHAFAYCAKNVSNNGLWRRYGMRAHAFLASHQRDALVYNAGAEIGTGFLLIAMIFTARRAILLTFLYWNWLRMRYFSPDAATYHSMVWSLIDQKVGLYVRRVLILMTGLGYAQRWFLSVGGT